MSCNEKEWPTYLVENCEINHSCSSSKGFLSYPREINLIYQSEPEICNRNCAFKYKTSIPKPQDFYMVFPHHLVFTFSSLDVVLAWQRLRNTGK